ncbi:MAG: alkaline phosphatase family protein [Solirubrobacteraceae bacterium]|nr:alkaline phosphatase family protein [Solirubrobacteraceae bacterium]
MARRLIFAVIDGCGPEQLRRAIDQGRAPLLARAVREGAMHESIAAFPSVTPVCATALATGARQDGHRIPGMNWWDRSRGRYVEYGSSFTASRRLGIARQLADTVYNLNGRHLAPELPTVFEALDDRGVRTAGTTYLVYRGRYRHELATGTTINRAVAAVFRRPVMGPRELFYADLFASRDVPCHSQFGMPGQRDQHTGCAVAYIVEHDLVDFALMSLPDNDTHSHKQGPEAQVDTIAAADRQLTRVADAAGGIDRFFAEWALVVASDHGHARIDRVASVRSAFERFGIVGPTDPESGAGRRPSRAARRGAPEPRIAFCPNSRAAMVYVLDREERDALLPEVVDAARAADGVELVVWRDDAGGHIASGPDLPDAHLRFRPAGDAPPDEGWTTIRDERGGTWHVDGDLDLVGLRVVDGRASSASHPDPLARCWSALACATSGDVLLSAAPGVEFPDFGGVHHRGAGSHGSLRAEDSTGILVHCGVGRAVGEGPSDDDPRGNPALDPDAWSIADATPMIVRHFDMGRDADRESP